MTYTADLPGRDEIDSYILKFVDRFEHKYEIFHTTGKILDRFLDHDDYLDIPKSNLVVLTAMYIAMKFWGEKNTNVRTIGSTLKVSKRDVIDMECKILNKLEFEIPYH